MTPPTPTDILESDDGRARCWWCCGDPIYVRYHDEEWGVPTDDDRYLFEKICLEGFQAGLSWLTILRKRQRFREVFHGFEPRRIVRMSTRDVDRLMQDPGIVRHRGKIESTINNARRAIEVADSHGSLAAYLWSFAPAVRWVQDSAPKSRIDVPSVSVESKALSRGLRGMGFTFVGPTTMYAFMQAVGMVNDHLPQCHRREPCMRLRQRFEPPA